MSIFPHNTNFPDSEFFGSTDLHTHTGGTFPFYHDFFCPKLLALNFLLIAKRNVFIVGRVTAHTATSRFFCIGTNDHPPIIPFNQHSRSVHGFQHDRRAIVSVNSTIYIY